MRILTRTLKVTATIGLVISCYVSSALASGLSGYEFVDIKPLQEPLSEATRFGVVAKVTVVALEPEAQQAVDYMTELLTAAFVSEYAPDAESYVSKNTWNDVQNDAFEGMNNLRFVTLEAESSQAIEQMKRLLQQGQDLSYTPDTQTFDFR